MDTQIKIDKAGRVVIPKPLREALNLSDGDALELHSVGEEITLRPVRGTMPLQKERGVWVYRTDVPLKAETVNEVLRRGREARDGENLGKPK